jgi:hypothetical protein
MQISLSTLAVILGLGVAALQVFGLAKPAAFTEAARKFPRSMGAGVFLMLLGTVWFVYNLSLESIADFAAFKGYLMMGFAAIGILTCIFVRDYLGARGWGVVVLLLAKLMVDTGRPYLDKTAWVLVWQAWAYVLVIAGMWVTISPWRMREFLAWNTATPERLRIGCSIRLAFGLSIALLGVLKFH